MIQDIEAISYTAGLLERGMHPSGSASQNLQGHCTDARHPEITATETTAEK